MSEKSNKDHKAIKGALERIADLEDQAQRIVNGVTSALAKLEERLQNLESLMTACIEILGKEVVTQKVAEAQEAAIAKMVAAKKASLETAVAEGKLVKADAIGPQTVVEGEQIDENGAIVPPGYVQAFWSQLTQEQQTAASGKGIGTMIAFPDGKQFKVTEIYSIVPPKAENDKTVN